MQVDGVYYSFTVLVFGSGSAPTVWGRFAALLGRSTMLVSDPDRLRLEIYVDDPVYAVRGTEDEAARAVARAVL